jgi:hypothetical protein
MKGEGKGRKKQRKGKGGDLAEEGRENAVAEERECKQCLKKYSARYILFKGGKDMIWGRRKEKMFQRKEAGKNVAEEGAGKDYY